MASIFGAFICVFLCVPPGFVAGTTSTHTVFLTSCTNSEVPPSTIPNLSFAKVESTSSEPLSCSNVSTIIPADRTLTHFYYENYPQTCGDDLCCHNTTTSTLHYLTSSVNVTSGVVELHTGCITGGIFQGGTFTETYTILSLNPNACNAAANPIGMEARSGLIVFVITKPGLLGAQLPALTCTGISYQEYCPGLLN